MKILILLLFVTSTSFGAQNFKKDYTANKAMLEQAQENFLKSSGKLLQLGSDNKYFYYRYQERDQLYNNLKPLLKVYKSLLNDADPKYNKLRASTSEVFFNSVSLQSLYFYNVSKTFSQILANKAAAKVLEDIDNEKGGAYKKMISILLRKIDIQYNSPETRGVPSNQKIGKATPTLSSAKSPSISLLSQNTKSLNKHLGKLSKNKRIFYASVLNENIDGFLKAAPIALKHKKNFHMFLSSDLLQDAKKELLYITGKIYLPKGYKMTAQDVVNATDLMEPGDIALIKHRLKLTNIAISGHWTHGVFYVGQSAKVESYFANDYQTNSYYSRICKKENKNCSTFSEYLDALKKEIKPELDKASIQFETIESLGEGVIFSKAKSSMKKDRLVVFRPNFTKLEKAKAIELAFKLTNRPYDYGFDLRTQNQMVCTELIYNVYSQGLEGRDVLWKNKVVLGSPVIYAQDIYDTYEAEQKTANPRIEKIFSIYEKGKKKETP